MPATTGPAVTSVPRPVSYDYGIFILDADTGVDPLIYYESTPALCGGTGTQPPSVAVPVSQWSVPWTLVSRDPRGYSAAIQAQVLSCDGYDPTATSSVAPRPSLSW